MDRASVSLRLTSRITFERQGEEADTMSSTIGTPHLVEEEGKERQAVESDVEADIRLQARYSRCKDIETERKVEEES